jgi:hypothetical protein
MRKLRAWAKQWNMCPTVATLVLWEVPVVTRVATSAGHSPTTGLLHPVRWSAKVVHAKCFLHSPPMSARGSVLPWGG